MITAKIEGFDVDKPNRNGRIYPRELIQNVIDDFVKEQKELYVVDRQSRYDELATVNVADIVGKVEKLELKEDGVYAEIKSFKIPNRIDLDVFKERGVVMELTPNGVGTIKEGNVVGEDYKLISISVGVAPMEKK